MLLATMPAEVRCPKCGACPMLKRTPDNYGNGKGTPPPRRLAARLLAARLLVGRRLAGREAAGRQERIAYSG